MRFALFIALLAAGGSFGSAQGPRPIPALPAKPAAPLPKSHAETRFEAALDAVAKTLSEAPAYRLVEKSRWTFRLNGEVKEGTNHFEATLQKPNLFRITAAAEGRAEPAFTAFTAIADGRAVTRLMPAAKIFSVDETAKPFEELPDDALTAKELEGSYLTALLRPDLKAAFLDAVDRVEAVVPDKGAPNRETFKLLLDNRKELLMTIETGAKPRIVRLVTAHAVHLDEKRKAEMTIDTSLEWDLEARPAPGTFEAKVPRGLTKVDDLMDALTGAGSAELLGKPAPPLKFKTLDGKEIDVAGHRGQGVTVLYFYAGWSAPSAEEMPAANKFFETYANRGVALYAVNVGETADEIRKHAAKAGFAGTVLRDEKGEVLSALNLGSVPVSVLIGKDGTVQGIYKGSKPEVKRELREGLDALLAGKTLIEKK